MNPPGQDYAADAMDAEAYARELAELVPIWWAMDAPDFVEAVAVDADGTAWGVWSPWRTLGAR